MQHHHQIDFPDGREFPLRPSSRYGQSARCQLTERPGQSPDNQAIFAKHERLKARLCKAKGFCMSVACFRAEQLQNREFPFFVIIIKYRQSKSDIKCSIQLGKPMGI